MHFQHCVFREAATIGTNKQDLVRMQALLYLVLCGGSFARRGQ